MSRSFRGAGRVLGRTSLNGVCDEPTGWALTMWRRFTPHVLPMVAFAAAFPAAVNAPTPYLQELLHLTTVPGYLQAVVVGVLAAVAAAMARRRRWPLFLVGAVDVLFRSSGLVVAVTSYVVATTWRRRRQLIGYGLVASAAAVLPTAEGELRSRLGGVLLFVWLPMLLGLWINARRQVLTGLRERAERLEREQVARAEQARAQERARIAHDMHDVVAHRVSLMVLHAGALEIKAADADTAATAELIRTTGKEALGQLRSVLRVLSAPDGRRDADASPAGWSAASQPTLADLDWLLDQSRSAGISIERRDEGERYPLPPLVDQTAYRVVQEALTNIHKHAGGAATRVVVRHLPGVFEVSVENTAPAAASSTLPGSGFGLIGLTERVGFLGGEFTAEPTRGGGFLVSARLRT